MKTQYTLDWNRPFAFAAWALFAVSFLLPSYGEMRGYQCAALHAVFWSQAIHGHWPSIHYLLLTLPNVLMLASPWLLSRSLRDARSVRWVCSLTLIAAALVWSFLALLLAYGDGANLRVGSYIWASSFVLLSTATILRQSRSPERSGLNYGTLCA